MAGENDKEELPLAGFSRSGRRGGGRVTHTPTPHMLPTNNTQTTSNFEQVLREELDKVNEATGGPQNTTSVDSFREVVTAAMGMTKVEIIRDLDEIITRIVSAAIDRKLNQFTEDVCKNNEALERRLGQVERSLNNVQNDVTGLQVVAERSEQQTNSGRENFSRRTSQDANTHPNYNNYQFSKWGIRWNGSNMSAEDFIHMLSRMQNAYKYPWQAVMDHFHMFLEGKVLEWYLNFTKNQSNDWPTVSAAIIDHYDGGETDDEIWEKMRHRRQGYNEQFMSYYGDIFKMKSRLKRERSDFEVIRLMKSGVNDKISSYVFSIHSANVSQFVSHCKEAEKIANIRSSRSQSSSSYTKYTAPKISEVNDSEGNDNIEELEIDAIRKAIDFSKVTCYRCTNKGHFSTNCSNEKRCLKCGKIGVMLKECECSENFRRNENGAGDPRSYTNPESHN